MESALGFHAHSQVALGNVFVFAVARLVPNAPAVGGRVRAVRLGCCSAPVVVGVRRCCAAFGHGRQLVRGIIREGGEVWATLQSGEWRYGETSPQQSGIARLSEIAGATRFPPSRE